MRPMVVVVPKRTTHCPVCGLAITLDASIRIRPAPGSVPKNQRTVEDIMPPPDEGDEMT